ncbi:COG1470 family protein, partial [Fervidobacterium sp.]
MNQPLTLSAQASTPTGTYRLKVRATSGSLTRDADLTVTVSASGGGGGGGGGGSTSGTVNTPGGQVGVSLQGGTFTQGPTAQNVAPPQGFQAPYGAIAFTAQVPQGGTLTVTLTFPNPIPQGAQLQKYLNNAWQAIPGAQLSGNTATYQVQDGGPLDADGQANGQVVDPVALLTPPPSFTLSDPTPNPLTVLQGGTATFQVTLTSQNGFQGQVILNLADGQDPLPQGLAITATDPSPISLQAGGSVTVTATVSAGQGVAPSALRLRVRAQGGDVVQEKPLTVQVASFDLSPLSASAVTTSRDPSRRTSNWVAFTLTPLNGFRGQVDLSLVDEGGNPVPGLSLDPPSVNVTGTQNF